MGSVYPNSGASKGGERDVLDQATLAEPVCYGPSARLSLAALHERDSQSNARIPMAVRGKPLGCCGKASREGEEQPQVEALAGQGFPSLARECLRAKLSLLSLQVVRRDYPIVASTVGVPKVTSVHIGG